jgi:cytochrome c oxidase subunit 3
LPSVAEVQAGFEAHPDLLIRTEVIYEADEATMKDAKINHDLTKIKKKQFLQERVFVEVRTGYLCC